MDVRSAQESLAATVEFVREAGMSDQDLIEALEQLKTEAEGRLLAVKDGSPQIKPKIDFPTVELRPRKGPLSWGRSRTSLLGSGRSSAFLGRDWF